MSDLIQRLNAGIDVTNRRLLTLRTQQDIELALVFREILTETRDEIERLGRELTEARDGIKEVMSDHADTLARLDAALEELKALQTCPNCGLQYTGFRAETAADQPDAAQLWKPYRIGGEYGYWQCATPSGPYNFQAADEAAAIAVCKREKAAHQPTGGEK